MFYIKIEDFDIEQIALSGQCFRLSLIENNVWNLTAKNRNLKIYKISKNEYNFDCSSEEFQKIWFDYFDLETDYSYIKKTIKSFDDPYLQKAVEYGWGIRILRQDLWETIVTFIISQRNNIPKIKGTIRKLCNPFEGQFPSPALLSDYSEDDFKKLGLGYRARYLVDIVKSVMNGSFDIEYLRLLPTIESLRYLQKFNGIGPKVANCIALFSLHKIDAFPIDVWIERIIKERYNGKFSTDKFKNFAGIVQQYMFFYERNITR